MAGLDFDFAPLTAPRTPDRHEEAALISSAHVQAEAIREAARAEGLATGQAEALDSVAPSLAALAEAVAAAQAHGEAAAERLEAEAVELAFLIAEKVVGARIEVDPSVVLEAARGALRGVVERERVTVLVNPADLDFLRAAADELAASLGGIEQLEIQAERRVARGGALIRHDEGSVDAQIETKLERAREAVAERLAA